MRACSARRSSTSEARRDTKEACRTARTFGLPPGAFRRSKPTQSSAFFQGVSVPILRGPARVGGVTLTRPAGGRKQPTCEQGAFCSETKLTLLGGGLFCWRLRSWSAERPWHGSGRGVLRRAAGSTVLATPRRPAHPAVRPPRPRRRGAPAGVALPALPPLRPRDATVFMNEAIESDPRGLLADPLSAMHRPFVNEDTVPRQCRRCGRAARTLLTGRRCRRFQS